MKKYPLKEYLKCYWKFIKPYLGRQIFLFFTIIISTLLGLTSPFLMGILIDRGLAKGDMHMVYIILGISLSVLVFESIFLAIQDYLMGYIRSRLGYDLRIALFKKVSERDVFFFQKKNTGELMSRIINEVRDVLSLFSTSMIMFLTQAITLLGTAGIMFYLNWKLAGIAILAIPLVIVTVRYFNPRLREGNKKVFEDYAKASSVLQENLQGINILKNFHKEGYGVIRFSKALHTMINSQMKVILIRIVNSQFLSYIYAIAPVALIIFGGKMVIDGTMTVGAFVSFYGYLGRFYQPVRSLININVELQQTLVAFYRFYELLNSFGDTEDSTGKKNLDRIKDGIELKNVTFGYDEKETLLENFTLKIRPGQMVGIVGRNGIGKSTLFGLLSGLYQPFQGSVRLDGIDISMIKKSSLQQLYGIVPQDTYLFNMSIYENIALGRRNLSEEKMIELAEMLNIINFIDSLPQGFETMAEKNGENFSGGQRQKIGIIRALINDPQIILLDEATSAIDVETEEAFFKWLWKNKEDRIILYISHKPHLLQFADLVLKFEGINQVSVERITNAESITVY